MMVLSLHLIIFDAFSNNPIILKGIAVSKDAKLLLFVPGKVPPEDYVSFVKSSQEKSASDMNLYVAIVRCGQLNLCNPLGSLNSEILTMLLNKQELLMVTTYLRLKIFSLLAIH